MIKKDNQTICAIYKGSTPIQKIYKGSVLVWEERELPHGYIQLDYIESTGTQYINTGISQVTPQTEIEMDFKITGDKYYQALYCSRKDTVHYTRTLFITRLYGFRNDVEAQRNITKSLSLEQMYNLKSTKINLILNNEIIDTYNLSITLNSELTLLNSYIESTQEMSGIFGALVKLYKCKIWEDDILIRNFIPCKNASGTIGLYDTVTKQFYTNAGTGEFIAGPEILNPDNPDVTALGELEEG